MTGKTKRYIGLLLILCFSLCMFGCQSREEKLAAQEEARLASEAAAEELRLAEEAAAEEARKASEAAAELEKQMAAEEKIIELLEWTPAIDGFALSLAEAINGTFHKYDWSFEPYTGGEDCYIVTFTGYYSPNPRDLPQLSQNGSISWYVDLAQNTISLHSDPNDISSAFILLAIPY